MSDARNLTKETTNKVRRLTASEIEAVAGAFKHVSNLKYDAFFAAYYLRGTHQRPLGNRHECQRHPELKTRSSMMTKGLDATVHEKNTFRALTGEEVKFIAGADVRDAHDRYAESSELYAAYCGSVLVKSLIW
jgi:hypothetical protein